MDYLTPEQLQEYMRMVELEDQKGHLERQMKLADQLRLSEIPTGHTTGPGAAFGALGGVLDRIGGARQGTQAQAASQTNARDQAQIQKDFLTEYMRQMREQEMQQNAQQPPPTLRPSGTGPFGF